METDLRTCVHGACGSVLMGHLAETGRLDLIKSGPQGTPGGNWSKFLVVRTDQVVKSISLLMSEHIVVIRLLSRYNDPRYRDCTRYTIFQMNPSSVASMNFDIVREMFICWCPQNGHGTGMARARQGHVKGTQVPFLQMAKV